MCGADGLANQPVGPSYAIAIAIPKHTVLLTQLVCLILGVHGYTADMYCTLPFPRKQPFCAPSCARHAPPPPGCFSTTRPRGLLVVSTHSSHLRQIYPLARLGLSLVINYRSLFNAREKTNRAPPTGQHSRYPPTSAHTNRPPPPETKRATTVLSCPVRSPRPAMWRGSGCPCLWTSRETFRLLLGWRAGRPRRRLACRYAAMVYGSSHRTMVVKHICHRCHVHVYFYVCMYVCGESMTGLHKLRPEPTCFDVTSSESRAVCNQGGRVARFLAAAAAAFIRSFASPLRFRSPQVDLARAGRGFPVWEDLLVQISGMSVPFIAEMFSQ